MKCGGCFFWRKIRDEDYEEWPGPHGECRLIDESSQDQPAWLGATVPKGEELGDIYMITRPDFGCELGREASPEGEPTDNRPRMTAYTALGRCAR